MGTITDTTAHASDLKVGDIVNDDRLYGRLTVTAIDRDCHQTLFLARVHATNDIVSRRWRNTDRVTVTIPQSAQVERVETIVDAAGVLVGLQCPRCGTGSHLQAVYLREVGYPIFGATPGVVMLDSDDDKASEGEEPKGWSCTECAARLADPVLPEGTEMDWV